MADLKKPSRRPCRTQCIFSFRILFEPICGEKTDFDGFKFDKPYTGGKHKVLMVASDARYLEMKNGK